MIDEEKVDFVDDVKITRVVGRPFEKGNTIGFKGHPENINYEGGPKKKVISDAYRVCLETDISQAIFEKGKRRGADGTLAEADSVLGKLEPLVKATQEALGRTMTYAEVLALGMVVSAMGGNSTAAKEIRETTEGRLPERIDLSGKIDYTAGAVAKDVLTGKLVGKEEEGVEPPS